MQQGGGGGPAALPPRRDDAVAPRSARGVSRAHSARSRGSNTTWRSALKSARIQHSGLRKLRAAALGKKLCQLLSKTEGQQIHQLCLFTDRRLILGFSVPLQVGRALVRCRSTSRASRCSTSASARGRLSRSRGRSTRARASTSHRSEANASVLLFMGAGLCPRFRRVQ